MKILIVDDKKEDVYLLETLLKASGYEVVSAANGANALETIRAEGCDMIISDILMPIMDGFQFCREVKSVTQLQCIPFVFYSANYTDDRDEEFALKSGADMFIRKPIAPDEFIKIIQDVVRQTGDGKIGRKEPFLEKEKKGFAFYNERMVKKLEKKMTELKREISMRKRVEEELRRERDFSRTLFQSSPAFFVIINAQGKTREMNRSMLSALGYTAEEVIGTDYLKTFVPFAEHKVLSDIFEQLTKQNVSTVNENRVLTKDGQELQVEWHGMPIQKENGELDYFFGVGIDITERKKAEETLKETYDIISKSPAVAFLWKNDETLPVEFVSHNVKEIFDYTAEEFMAGKVTYSETIYPQDLERVVDEIADYSKEDGKQRFAHRPYRIITKEGKLKWVENKTVTRRDEKGTITHYQGIVEDITEIKKASDEKKILEKNLIQAQKMEAIGTLTGGIAHDFNNILSVIFGYTEMIGMFDVIDDSPTRAKLDSILDAARRAKDLVKQILTFSRQTEQELRPVRLPSLVKETLKFLRASLPATIEILPRIEVKTGTILADPTQMHQILMNLCTNAGHAMGETGGVLEVELNDVELDAQAAGQHLELKPGSYITLTVRDTGHGISNEVMERMFTPYFTTKEPDEGTGMGLSVVHGIVKNHGGAITVESALGKGTTFQVFLPKLVANAVKDEARQATQVSEGNECIMFVDDEDHIVDIGKRVLGGLGYDIVGQAGSVEALETFRTSPHRFDLVITDQTMPNMTGLKLAEELMRIRSDIPVILCSGLNETVTQDKAKAAGVREFVAKPFGARNLAENVRKVLDQENAGS